jgi:phosphoribosylanthranilate isomerase
MAMESRMFLKICGIQTPAEAEAAIAAGATAFGVLLGLTHAAEDQVTKAAACDILRAIGNRAETVMVTHLLDAAGIAALAAAIGARAIQVHGDLPPEGMRRLRALAPGRRLIKAIHVTGPEALGKAAAYAGSADALLLDSRTADRLGGTGRTHDWSFSRAIVQASPVPVYLAGGLRAGNVREAIEAVRPAGVDVNSGVEDATGAKDPMAMRDFLRAARAALEGRAGGA